MQAMAADRQIVLLGSGFQRPSAGNREIGPLLRHVVGLAGPRPKLCLLNTAMGDEPGTYTHLYSAFTAATDARVTHLALFPMPTVLEPAAHLLGQDIIFVGGGSVANLMAVWRVHGLDVTLREAWERGTILCGVSAGAICWCVGGTTDSFGYELRPFVDGLGLLAGSHSPHYDTEEQRRPTFHRLIGDGTLPAGWATDEGTALHFVGGEIADVIADRPAVACYRVERSGGAAVTETRLEPRLLAG
ncbi:MAG: peptidase E [Acidimicrobiales bacterium]